MEGASHITHTLVHCCCCVGGMGGRWQSGACLQEWIHLLSRYSNMSHIDRPQL